MCLLLLGYFLLLSFTEGSKTAFTCSPGQLTATCDAGRVMLIHRVRRGHYSGTFRGSHCRYQVGDSTENYDGNSKQVWIDCNLQSTCSVPFIQSGNYYLQMDYECVYKSNIDMLDICDTGNGTRLVSNHGYIHSPCFPNLSTWTTSTHAYCQCSGTFHFPVKMEDLTVSIFHAFQETESLEIRWRATPNPPETVRNTSPSFITEQHTTRSIHLQFYSSYRGSDWESSFWLELKANSPLEFKCSNAVIVPPNCQLPYHATILTTTPTTTATRRTTATTTTTPRATTASNLSPIYATSKERGGSRLKVHDRKLIENPKPSNQDVNNILTTVGVAAPLIIISAIILWKNGSISRLCKYHSDVTENDAAQNNESVTPGMPVYENVGTHASESTFVNRAFVGDQNPSVPKIPDTVNSSDINVPDILATPTENYNQRMPTYENVEPNGRSQSVLGTDTQHREAAVSKDGNGSPYAEIGDNGPFMSDVGAAVAFWENAESPYAKLDSVERTEYLDLRHLGLPGAAAALGVEAESPYAKLDPVEFSEYLDLRHLGFPGAAAAPREEVESSYAKLDPEERLEYLDLRYPGLAHSQAK